MRPFKIIKQEMNGRTLIQPAEIRLAYRASAGTTNSRFKVFPSRHVVQSVGPRGMRAVIHRADHLCRCSEKVVLVRCNRTPAHVTSRAPRMVPRNAFTPNPMMFYTNVFPRRGRNASFYGSRKLYNVIEAPIM